MMCIMHVPLSGVIHLLLEVHVGSDFFMFYFCDTSTAEIYTFAPLPGNEKGNI